MADLQNVGVQINAALEKTLLGLTASGRMPGLPLGGLDPLSLLWNGCLYIISPGSIQCFCHCFLNHYTLRLI
jgi:hypothetical protein